MNVSTSGTEIEFVNSRVKNNFARWQSESNLLQLLYGSCERRALLLGKEPVLEVHRFLGCADQAHRVIPMEEEQLLPNRLAVWQSNMGAQAPSPIATLIKN